VRFVGALGVRVVNEVVGRAHGVISTHVTTALEGGVGERVRRAAIVVCSPRGDCRIHVRLQERVRAKGRGRKREKERKKEERGRNEGEGGEKGKGGSRRKGQHNNIFQAKVMPFQ